MKHVGEECLACKLHLSQSFLLPGLELIGPPEVLPPAVTVVATKVNEEHFISFQMHILMVMFKDQQQERK